jgi:hypothetical protein
MGGYNPDFKMQQVEAWSLSVQQQFRNNLIMQLNYSGTEAHHLLEFNNDINRFAGDLIQNNNVLTRLNPNFSGTAWGNSDANSIGNYGSVSVVRSFTNGFSLRGVYTYGKALDTMSQAQSLDSGSITSNTNDVYISNDLAYQRGRADFDIRQQFTANGIWDVPSPYSSRALKALLGGWEFGGVWVGYTGLPFTVHNASAFVPVCSGNAALVNDQCPQGTTIVGDAGGDYNADGLNNDLPNAPSFGRHLSGQSKKQFLNGIFQSSAFPAPSLGVPGNLGRNTYDSPGYKIMNFTFEKYFNAPWFFAEKIKIEAKGEVFNLFNRTNLGSVDSSLTDSTFGKSTSQLPPRSLQLHLRASF